MRYILQRVVHNDAQWKYPTKGRKGSKLDGGYLRDYGFGHEDWNFSKDVASDGDVYGYSYFTPSDPSELFCIAFATYDSGVGWSLAGFYINARFEEEGFTYPDKIILRRARELVELDAVGDLGGEYRNRGQAGIIPLLKKDERGYRWRVKPGNILSLAYPIADAKHVIPSNATKHFSRPTNITERTFKSLIKLAKQAKTKHSKSNYDVGGELEFPEGSVSQRKHFARERSVKLVKKAKAAFKSRHGRIYCEVCKFDFSESYGEVGVDFIEAHHVIPVSQLKPGSKTKLSDIAMVCSNCHRMLHRKRPWPSIKNLRDLVEVQARKNSVT